MVRRSTDLVPGLLAMTAKEWLGRQAERPWAGQEAIMAPSWNPIGPVTPITPGLAAGPVNQAGPEQDSGEPRDLAHLVSGVEGGDLV